VKLSENEVFSQPDAWPVTAVADESELSSLCQDKTFFVKMNVL